MLDSAISRLIQGPHLFKKNDNIVFEIKDTGIGIPKDEKERLFSEFLRASNAKTLSETGTGLGLAIIKAHVEQHVGSTEVESKEGKGTTFRIFLFFPWLIIEVSG